MTAPDLGSTAAVLLSAALHAWWNLVFKRAGGSDTFLALSKSCEGLLLLPVVIVAIMLVEIPLGPLLRYGVVGAVLVLLNYRLLAAAYRRTELAVAYPVSRASILLFLPVLGAAAFGEQVNGHGAFGLVLIVAGVVLQSWRVGGEWTGRATSGIALALGAAAAAACYTAWDKAAVQVLPPIVYFALYTVLVALLYALPIVARARAQLSEVWATQWRAVLQASVGNTASYMLVLVALRGGTSSYVIGVRQLSIAMGAGLGWWLLGERLGTARVAGLTLLLGGCGLILFAS